MGAWGGHSCEERRIPEITVADGGKLSTRIDCAINFSASPPALWIQRARRTSTVCSRSRWRRGIMGLIPPQARTAAPRIGVKLMSTMADCSVSQALIPQLFSLLGVSIADFDGSISTGSTKSVFSPESFRCLSPLVSSHRYKFQR